MFALVAHIFKNGNNTEEISMAPAQGLTHKFVKTSIFFHNNFGGAGKEGGEEIQEQGTSVYLRLIHADVSLKAIQYCKAITLQLNINKFNY